MAGDLADLRAAIERPERVSFWGKEYTVTPALLPQVFGDGGALLCVTPLDTRPSYYVVQIDSKWLAADADTDGGEFSDLIDDIENALEEHFGEAWPEHHDGCDDDCDGEHEEEPYREWPAVSLSSGVAWGRPWPTSDEAPRG